MRPLPCFLDHLRREIHAGRTGRTPLNQGLVKIPGTAADLKDAGADIAGLLQALEQMFL